MGGEFTDAVNFPVLLGGVGRLPVARRARGRGRVLAPPTYLPACSRGCGQKVNGVGEFTPQSAETAPHSSYGLSPPAATR
jgi:hypothetical protein